ncbi:hypothetical protein AK812_SmicGene9436 [Symbiodinium microadriaticum]|uniref:Uncharacterized protein n=1 Tax=Symbiodinium microadriaticum TaxID=2951 RepID=A0A1Q9EIK1_SYMMI|nr:hypothetical protein AK812_SmicGene9436 [Symbiodinium microadriaticum]
MLLPATSKRKSCLPPLGHDGKGSARFDSFGSDSAGHAMTPCDMSNQNMKVSIASLTVALTGRWCQMIRSALALLAAHLATAQQQQGGGMNPFAAMGGDQMIDSICKSFPNPLCPKKAVGAKSPDCQKNPNACCPVPLPVQR